MEIFGFSEVDLRGGRREGIAGAVSNRDQLADHWPYIQNIDDRHERG